ncbi:MAG: RNA-binding protein [Niabella sp. SCN 42-15]|nr:MAG: RNA-binding protein [Niabella sp. SCN 42-15]
MNIYVSNLAFTVSNEDLNELFATYGTVDTARIVTDKFTKQSRGFGFVEMPDDAAAQKAMEELNGTTNDGRAIKVVEARPREEKPRNNRW